MEDMGQGRLDQFPAGDALDGLRQLRRQPVELVLHQHSLKGLKDREEEEHQAGTEGSFSQQLNAPHCPKRGKARGTDRGRSVSTQQSLENIITDINLSWEEVRVNGGGGAIF